MELDLHLASISDGEESDNTFSRYSSALQRLSQLQTQLGTEKQTAVFLDQLVTYFSVKLANSPVSPSFRSLQSEASKSWQAVKQTVTQYICCCCFT